MLRLKPEVRFHDPRQALSIIALVVERCFDVYGVETVITSAGDGRHQPDSLHYRGLALDFRIRHLPAESRPALHRRVKDALPQCDVLWESAGTAQEHLHVEHDPNHDNGSRAGCGE